MMTNTQICNRIDELEKELERLENLPFSVMNLQQRQTRIDETLRLLRQGLTNAAVSMDAIATDGMTC